VKPQRARAELEAAFRSAHFRVECPDRSITRHIDQVDPAADVALKAAGCRLHWAILTPCNPNARALGNAENAERLAALRTQLDAENLRYLPSNNSAADGKWLEPGFCVLDTDPGLIEQLARQYGQAAYVTAKLNAAPALIWIS
jgi:hypothetical protein